MLYLYACVCMKETTNMTENMNTKHGKDYREGIWEDLEGIDMGDIEEK